MTGIHGAGTELFGLSSQFRFEHETLKRYFLLYKCGKILQLENISETNVN